MHPEARAFVQKAAWMVGTPERCVEIGSLNVNGTVRDIFPDTEWFGVDLISGNGVDWQGDFVDYLPRVAPDLIVCCEVLEHTPNVYGILGHAADILTAGGHVIVTCATVGRAPHGADGGSVGYGEYYENVPFLEDVPGLRVVTQEMHQARGDQYGIWRKGEDD